MSKLLLFQRLKIVLFIAFFFNLLTGNAKVIDDIFATGKLTIVLKESIDLQEEVVRLSPGTKILCEGGRLINGSLVLSDRCKIIGNRSEWYRVHICSTDSKQISISNLTLLFDSNESTNTALKFIQNQNVKLNSIRVKDFNHMYNTQVDSMNRNGYKWHVALFYECKDVAITDFKTSNVYPEGPFFYSCENVKLSELNINDKTNIKDRNLWSALHFFYCTNVSLKDSEFRKRGHGSNSGSMINACCHNLTIDNCTFVGSKGIDFSNEMKVKDFSSENVKMTNSKVLDSYYGFITGSNPGILKHLTFKNCEFKIRADKGAAVIYCQHVQDLLLERCKLSGHVILKFVSIKEYAHNLGDYTFKKCIIDNDCYNKDTLSQNLIVYAYSNDIEVGRAIFEKCTFNFDGGETTFSCNWGNQLDVVVNRCVLSCSTMRLGGGGNSSNLKLEKNRFYFLNPLTKGNVVLSGVQIR